MAPARESFCKSLCLCSRCGPGLLSASSSTQLGYPYSYMYHHYCTVEPFSGHLDLQDTFCFPIYTCTPSGHLTNGFFCPKHVWIREVPLYTCILVAQPLCCSVNYPSSHTVHTLYKNMHVVIYFDFGMCADIISKSTT